MEPESQNMVHHEPLRASNLISRQLGDDLLEEVNSINFFNYHFSYLLGKKNHSWKEWDCTYNAKDFR